LTARLAENNAVNATVIQLTATDLDLGDNAHFDYVIGDVTAYCADAAGCGDNDVIAEWFHADGESGLLSVTARLDREKHSHFHVTVYAVDRGLPAQTGSTIVQTGSTVVEIDVDDVNDQQPTFLSPRNSTGNSNGGVELAVSEDARDGAVLGRLRAVDLDATSPNNRIHYYFRSSRRDGAKFEVDTETGEVRLRGRLDREVESMYSLTAVATDRGQPALSAVQQLVIRVLDVNDNSPTFVFPTALNKTVTISPLLPPGRPVTRVLAHDPDMSWFMIQQDVQ